ncbi:MAG: primosomal protein N' [Deltaproteobacteria bacterium]|nr:primosomal protein N' [Deltaproteobacteria bacterium]
MSFVEVALAIPKQQTFTYRFTPEQLPLLKAGSRVLVPFGRRRMVGFALSFSTVAPTGGFAIKEILEVLDPEPVFSEGMLSLLKEVAEETFSPIGEVLKVALPAALGRPRFRLRTPVSGSPSPTVFGTAVRKSLRPFVEGFPSPPVLNLNSHQASALAKINEARQSGVKTFLLHGVTGSGKTEIYLQAIAEILKQGEQALLMTPEIGLTPQLVGRVRERFGQAVALFHSGLSDGERLLTWQSVREGKASVVVGTRSSIFLPFAKLGLVVMDEEQDASYKQEDRFRYSARDIAKRRCTREGGMLLLGSATPSLESFYECRGAMNHAPTYFFLPERATTKGSASGTTKGSASGTPSPLPTITICDRRQESKGSLFSHELLTALNDNLERGEQSLLFLNRRGFATFLVCTDCGAYFPCPHCHVSLTLHRRQGTLHCHYCDHRIPLPKECASCHGKIRELGFGTERVEEEIRELFPKARLARLDRDTMTRKGDWAEILGKLERHEIDILIGTQMIAKGHDYPKITLVGVLNADALLNFPDFRASEKTFHLLLQVAGRAGRGNLPGRVLIQTYHPDHPCFQTLQTHNILDFYETELKERKELFYPPYSHLIRLEWNGLDREKVKAAAEGGGTFLKGCKILGENRLLGPAPCPLEKLRRRYRWHLLIKVAEVHEARTVLKELLDAQAGPGLASSVRMIMDIDPLNLL